MSGQEESNLYRGPVDIYVWGDQYCDYREASRGRENCRGGTKNTRERERERGVLTYCVNI